MSIVTREGVEIEKGRVVAAGTYVTHYMSDIYGDKAYAIVLNPDGTYERVEGWDWRVTVDASLEEVKAYEDYKAKCAEEDKKLRAKLAAERREREAREKAEKERKEAERRAKNLAAEEGINVDKGDKVKIKTGKNKGQEGKVFWKGDGKAGTRLGVALSDRKDARGWHVDVAWVMLKNVEKAA